MLTFRKNPLVPQFCKITAKKDAPCQALVPHIEPFIGSKAIDDAVQIFKQVNPHIAILKYVVMPDHVHLMLYVTKPLTQPFGTLVGALKGSCSQAFWRLQPNSEFAQQKISIFERQFHDRIVKQSGQLEVLIKYILDNPRRYLIKRHYPDLFIARHLVTIVGKQYAAVGNIFLLREYEKDVVIVRSHYSTEERERLRERWMCLAENGGVLVSPFVSGKERAIRDAVLDAGGRVIEILDNGFPERYKPSGRAFDYCAKGQLLYIAPTEHHGERVQMTRELAWQMNNLAKTICEITPETCLSVK
jgi:REP element-mobilizing transposase RayT